MLAGSYIWQIGVDLDPFQPPHATILFPTSLTSAVKVGSNVSATRREAPVPTSIAKTIPESLRLDFVYLSPIIYAVPEKNEIYV